MLVKKYYILQLQILFHIKKINNENKQNHWQLNNAMFDMPFLYIYRESMVYARYMVHHHLYRACALYMNWSKIHSLCLNGIVCVCVPLSVFFAYFRSYRGKQLLTMCCMYMKMKYAIRSCKFFLSLALYTLSIINRLCSWDRSVLYIYIYKAGKQNKRKCFMVAYIKCGSLDKCGFDKYLSCGSRIIPFQHVLI